MILCLQSKRKAEVDKMSLSSHINEKANLIWAIADKLTKALRRFRYYYGRI